MSATTTARPSRPAAKELAHRAADGVDVTLLWSRREGRVFVRVQDGRTGDSFELTVPAGSALDAFHHPYAYASSLGVEFEAGQREPVYA
jgi:hypothetical protein